MVITSVSYRRVRSLPGYQSIAVEATGSVEDGDVPSMVLDDLRRWVERRLDEQEAEIRAAREVSQ